MLYLCFVLGSAQLLSGWAPNQTYHDNAAWWLSWIDGLVIAVSATSLQLSLLFKPTIILLKQWSCEIENDAVMFEWEQRSIQNITIHLFGCFPLPTVGQGVFSMTHYYTEDAPPLTGTGGLTDSYHGVTRQGTVVPDIVSVTVVPSHDSLPVPLGRGPKVPVLDGVRMIFWRDNLVYCLENAIFKERLREGWSYLTFPSSSGLFSHK